MSPAAFRPTPPRRGSPPARERKAGPRPPAAGPPEAPRCRPPGRRGPAPPTEADWLTGQPRAMLRCLVGAGPDGRGQPPRVWQRTERKVRLFYCACARLLGDPLPAVAGAVEAYADQGAASRRFREARSAAEAGREAFPGDDPPATWARAACDSLVRAAAGRRGFRPGALQEMWPLAPAAQVAVLTDLVGNPFRPVPFDDRWRTSDVVGMARGVYEDRAFDRMPLLADALMDAGCDDEQILGHCQSKAPHVRGCWVVDLVLARA